MRSNNAWLALCSLLLAAACDQPVTAPEDESPADVAHNARREPPPDIAQFNPQPEPPKDHLPITLYGPLDGLLRGNHRAGTLTGALTVETLSSLRRGEYLHVAQRWTVHPPNPILPSAPARPMVLELQGTVHMTTGDVVLAGGGETVGIAEVRAVASFGRGGASIGGELMFNPQPDPPKTIR
jgi:hypothetical protein